MSNSNFISIKSQIFRRVRIILNMPKFICTVITKHTITMVIHDIEISQ